MNEMIEMRLERERELCVCVTEDRGGAEKREGNIIKFKKEKKRNRRALSALEKGIHWFDACKREDIRAADIGRRKHSERYWRNARVAEGAEDKTRRRSIREKMCVCPRVRRG